MARFVLLYHDCTDDNPRSSHCDLMLEAYGALRTWAVAMLPCSWGATAGLPSSACAGVCVARENTIPAEQLADHRLAYLDYEGPISGDCGTVIRLDLGTFKSIKESPDEWIVALSGQEIRGGLTLRRTDATSSSWELSFEESATTNRQ